MGLVKLIIATIKAFFDSNTATARVVEKSLPNEEERKELFEIKKERLTVKQRREVLKEAERYLRRPIHLKMSVDSYAEVTFDSLDEEDKQDLKNALYELFPKRKHIKK